MTARTADELVRATAQLSAADVGSPRADAEWLLAHVLGVDRGRLLVIDEIDAEALVRYRQLVSQRSTRVPLQHLTGNAAFGPIELSVGSGVFIPRPETEALLEWALTSDTVATEKSSMIVDLCSGSGALAIALATLLPQSRVHAVEISETAVAWLRRNVNAAAPEVATRITVHHLDATNSELVVDAVGGPVDLVVSNPPYVPLDSPVPPEVHADPAGAVFGGADGLSVISPMSEVIAALLRPGGRVGIEHDDATAAAVREVLTGEGAFEEITTHADLAGRPRFVTARRTPAHNMRG